MTRDPVLVALVDGALAIYLENVLGNARGSAFVHLGRTLDMIELGFGSDVPAAGSSDPDRRLPSHVFHMQCPFRLDSACGVVVGSRDVYIDPLLGADTPDDFDWRPHRSNTFDAATASFFEAHPPGTLNCVSVAANNSGSIELLLDAGYVLRLFPNGSRMEEFWRYFQPDTSGEYVVVFNDRE